MSDTSAQTLLEIPAVRQILMLLAVAGAVAAGITVFFWGQQPGYQVLFSQMDDHESAEVVEALMSAGVDYRLDPNSGAVMVPADRMHELRMTMASQGLPSGGNAGFEMIREDPGLGVSQFVETARYQHALETELVRTITSIRAVRAARVHLAIPKPSAFSRNRQGPSASVFVELAPGRTLDPPQVESIVHLVSSSIPEMRVERVSVIDQNGRLLSSAGETETTGISSKQFEHIRKVEESFVRRIEALLMPMTGPGRVSAQVTLDMDFTFAEETRETYHPDSAAIRSEQIFEDGVSATNVGVGGRPGAASNSPAGANPTNGDGDGRGVERRTSRNYEMDRSISHTRQPSGRITRASVAVLVDHIPELDESGKLVPVPLSDRQMERVQALVREAVGFDEARGDSVSVMNARFQQPETIESEPLPFWQQAGMRDIGRQLIGALVVLVLAFAVLRPILRNLSQFGLQPNTVMAVSNAAALQDLGAQARPTSAAGPAGSLAGPPEVTFEQKLAAAQSAVKQDPKRVAQVVRGWVGDNA